MILSGSQLRLKTLFLCSALLVNWPVFGQANFNQSRFRLQGPADQSGSSVVIKDALNRPCLDVEAASRAHVVNRALFDHVVSINNKCARIIHVKVCYSGTENCKSLQVGSYHREDVLLGVMANVGAFAYSISQK